MSKLRDNACVLDILDSARNISNFIANKNFSDFETDIMLSAAVIRQFEIIGEAARRLTDDFKTEHSDISWKRMIGMRNVLIHRYEEANIENIWEVAVNNIPKLVEHLEKISVELK